MKLIAHRRNTIEELLLVPVEYGVEIDIRSYAGELILHHDPFCAGEKLEDWAACYRHQFLILNVKEEGLEQRILEVMDAHGIYNFFFLDQSFPFLIKWSRLGERRCAVRVSQFESIDTALTLSGKVDWVWVDCFSEFALTHEDFLRLKNAGFKLCIVSPELQGRNAEIEIPKMIEILRERQILVDAVCTKRIDLWGGNTFL